MLILRSLRPDDGLGETPLLGLWRSLRQRCRVRVRKNSIQVDSRKSITFESRTVVAVELAICSTLVRVNGFCMLRSE